MWLIIELIGAISQLIKKKFLNKNTEKTLKWFIIHLIYLIYPISVIKGGYTFSLELFAYNLYINLSISSPVKFKEIYILPST